MQKTKRTIKFYSEEEKEFLKPYLNVKRMSKWWNADLDAFCKKYKRTRGSVEQYLSNTRTRMKYRGLTETPTKVDKALPTLKRNEFIIPISNWEVRTESDGQKLVLKF